MNSQVSNIIGDIGLCRRAGFLISGFDPVIKEISKANNKVSGILTASDLSGKSFKEISFYADKHNKPVIKINVTMNDIEAVLKKRVGILAISNDGFFKNISVKNNKIF